MEVFFCIMANFMLCIGTHRIGTCANLLHIIIIIIIITTTIIIVIVIVIIIIVIIIVIIIIINPKEILNETLKKPKETLKKP